MWGSAQHTLVLGLHKSLSRPRPPPSTPSTAVAAAAATIGAAMRLRHALLLAVVALHSCAASNAAPRPGAPTARRAARAKPRSRAAARAVAWPRGGGQQLHAARALFLLYYAHLGSLMPYLPVYYHSLGLPGKTIGQLGAITPAATFVVARRRRALGAPSPDRSALPDRIHRAARLLSAARARRRRSGARSPTGRASTARCSSLRLSAPCSRASPFARGARSAG